jgi:hypothetical protein
LRPATSAAPANGDGAMSECAGCRVAITDSNLSVTGLDANGEVPDILLCDECAPTEPAASPPQKCAAHVLEIRLGAIYRFAARRQMPREAIEHLMRWRAGMKPAAARVLAAHWVTTEPFRQKGRADIEWLRSALKPFVEADWYATGYGTFEGKVTGADLDAAKAAYRSNVQ